MTRVLFYGSLTPEVSQQHCLREFLERLVKALLHQGATIVTREGRKVVADEALPIDVIVLDVACATCDADGLPRSRVSSYGTSSVLDSQGPSPHPRDVYRLPQGNHWTKYKHLLENCDVVVALGGREGTYRVGLLALALGHPLFPLQYAGGTALQLWEDIAAEPQNPDVDQRVTNILAVVAPPSDLASVHDLASAILNSAQRPHSRYLTPSIARSTTSRGTVTSWLKLAGALGALVATAASAGWYCRWYLDEVQSARAAPGAHGQPPLANSAKLEHRQ